MPATLMVNNLTVVHKSSDGMVDFLPDVCLTPAPSGPPVPVPYPNHAESKDLASGSSTVVVDGNSIALKGSFFSQSTGNEAGTVGGVTSGVTKGRAEFINYSFDVMVEGKNVARLGDLMLGNIGSTYNTPPMAETQPNQVVMEKDRWGESKRDKLFIRLVGKDGQPMKKIRYTMKNPYGKIVEGQTDSQGCVRLDETMTGSAEITFPDVDDISLVDTED